MQQTFGSPQDIRTADATPATTTMLPPLRPQETLRRDPLAIDLSTFGGKTPPPVDHHVGLTTPARTEAHDNGSGEQPMGGPVTLPHPNNKECLACSRRVGLFDIAGVASIDYHGGMHGV